MTGGRSWRRNSMKQQKRTPPSPHTRNREEWVDNNKEMMRVERLMLVVHSKAVLGTSGAADEHSDVDDDIIVAENPS